MCRIETAAVPGHMRCDRSKRSWRASDNFDVDQGAFIATKKTLMRLARLCGTECDVSLWMPLGPIAAAYKY